MQHILPRLSRRQFLQCLSLGVGSGCLMGLGLRRSPFSSHVAAVRQARHLLGTVVSITVHHPVLAEAEAAVALALRDIESVDRVMSIHRAVSDVSRVNAAAGRTAVTVDPQLIEVVAAARDWHDWTGGAYDITALPLLRLYGWYTANPVRRPPTDRMIQATLDAVGMRHVTLDRTRSQVGLTHAKAAIDLGSIGKGYAADRAAATLRRHGIEHALIDIGGNVLAIGGPHPALDDPAGWRIAIRNPQGTPEQPYFETLTLRDRAVATSGNYEQRRRILGREIGHLFDARTGHPAEQGLSTTVIATSGMTADAGSTSAYLLGTTSTDRLPPLEAIYRHG